MSDIDLPEPARMYLPPGVHSDLSKAEAWYTAEQFRAAILAERERCARVCDGRVMGDNNREDEEAKRCAAAIRRGSV